MSNRSWAQLPLEATPNVGALSAEDVGVEVIIASQVEHGQSANIVNTLRLELTNVDVT